MSKEQIQQPPHSIGNTNPELELLSWSQPTSGAPEIRISPIVGWRVGALKRDNDISGANPIAFRRLRDDEKAAIVNRRTGEYWLRAGHDTEACRAFMDDVMNRITFVSDD